MVIGNYYNPNGGYLADFSCYPGLKNCWHGGELDLSSGPRTFQKPWISRTLHPRLMRQMNLKRCEKNSKETKCCFLSAKFTPKIIFHH